MAAGSSLRHARVCDRAKARNWQRNGLIPSNPDPKCTLLLAVLSAHPADRLCAAYLKCNDEMEASVLPYLPSSLTVEGETIRRLAR
jgi:hypothetical protein